MNGSSKKVAVCGVTAALSITTLFFGFLFPFTTYACPAIAAILLLPISYEYHEKTAFTLYIAVSMLAIFLIPDKELVLIYVVVFGLYTILKFKIDSIKSTIVKITLKIIYVNLALLICYSLLLIVFPVQALLQEFAQFSFIAVILMILTFNVVFIVYDFALSRFFIVYYYRLRPIIFKK